MPKDHWSGAELLTELARFEAELRAANLNDNTVETYIERSETFIRWLMGKYTPRAPKNAFGKADQRAEPSLGAALLDDLRANLDRTSIARYLADYGAVTGYDKSFRHLLDATGNHLDLGREGHRVAVINWLRAWGCRHLRRADTHRTAEALRLWWDAFGEKLPAHQTAITELSEPELAVIERAYDALRTAIAAGRAHEGGEVNVVFGDTATAKAMFAARPNAFLPWDEPIRLAFGWAGGGAAYVQLLRLSASALDGLSRRLAVAVAELPSALGRPDSPPPKLVDEYLWVRITRGL